MTAKIPSAPACADCQHPIGDHKTKMGHAGGGSSMRWRLGRKCGLIGCPCRGFTDAQEGA